MDEYEGLLFKGVKDVTLGKRTLPRGTQPRRKKDTVVQDIIDGII